MNDKCSPSETDTRASERALLIYPTTAKEKKEEEEGGESRLLPSTFLRPSSASNIRSKDMRCGIEFSSLSGAD